MKNLKNYTSEIPVNRTIDMIEKLVVEKMHARQFFKSYENGQISGIVIVIPTDHGDLPYKMPANVEKVEALFYANKKPRYNWQKPEPLTVNEKEQARRTAWKNIHDWLDAQIALIQTEQAKVEQVMLPYQTNAQGMTVFEWMEGRNMALPAGKSELQEGEVING